MFVETAYQGALAFNNMQYKKAHELFTNALNEAEETDIHGRLTVLSLRASSSLKLKNYTEALVEAEDVLRLDETHASGYLYCGKALYGLGDKKRANDAVNRGLKLDPEHPGLKHWIEVHKEPIIEQASSCQDIPHEKMIVTYAHAQGKSSIAQTSNTITITILINGLKKDDVRVELVEDSIIKIILLGFDGEYMRLDVPYPVDLSRTVITAYECEIEIKLFKSAATEETLDFQSPTCRSIMRPTSSLLSLTWRKMTSWFSPGVYHEKLE